MESELLKIVACPVCKGELLQSADGANLQCHPCGLEYPVCNDIPKLLTDQANAITDTAKIEVS
jgi:uncharacterized protein YbaR (Trm112 family)